MSRSKLWLPPTKFGSDHQPVRPLPVVRIKGIDTHSNLGQQIIGMFSGQISQFHMASAHNYSLAPQAVYLSRRDLPDIRMRYINLHGQEIINIAVNPTIVEQLTPPAPRTPWDWLLIDLDFIPPTYTSEFFGTTDASIGQFRAVLRFPNAPNIGSQPRSAGNNEPMEPHSSEDTPIMQYAESTLLYPELASSTDATLNQVSSLLVDIRRYPTEEEIIVDLWGRLDGHPDDIVETETLTGSTFAGYVDHQNEYGDHFLHFRNGYSLEEVHEVYPEFAAYTLWTDNMPYDPFHDYDTEIDNFGPASTAHTAWGTFTANSTGFTAQDTYPLYTYLDEVTALPVDGGGAFRGKHRWREFRYFDGSVFVYNTAPPVLPGSRQYGHYDREFFHMPTYEIDSVETPIPSETTATMRAIAFKGTPQWGRSEHIMPGFGEAYYQWEFADMYPDRHTVPLLAEDIPLADSPIFEPNYLGAVHFFQKDGAFVFKPA